MQSESIHLSDPCPACGGFGKWTWRPSNVTREHRNGGYTHDCECRVAYRLAPSNRVWIYGAERHSPETAMPVAA